MTFDNCKFDEKIIPEKLRQLPKSTLKTMKYTILQSANIGIL